MKHKETMVFTPDDSAPNIPFPTTEEQKANLPEFLDKLLKAGIATDFVERMVHLAATDQGMYDLIQLWIEHDGNPEEQEQDMVCIENSLNGWGL